MGRGSLDRHRVPLLVPFAPGSRCLQQPLWPQKNISPCRPGYLHVCNAVVTAQRHLQASSQSDAFDGRHHRLLAAFDERHDGAQGTPESLRSGESSDVSSWGSTKRSAGISRRDGDWKNPSLCASCSQMPKLLQSILLAGEGLTGITPFWDQLQGTLEL